MSNRKFDLMFATSFATKTVKTTRATRPAKIGLNDDCAQDGNLDYVLENLDAIGDDELLAAVLRTA